MSAAEAIPISSAKATDRNIYQRVREVMREVRGVEKTGFNSHSKYKFAGHEAVTEATRDAFVKHGIVQTVSMLECSVLDGGVLMCKVRVTWSCDDCPSSCMVSDEYAIQPSQTSKGGVTAQQVGQALSYAVKNVFFKQLMLTGDPERDSDAEPVELANNQRRSDPPRQGPEFQKAAEYLAQFGMCNTAAEVSDLRALLRKAWSEENLKIVPDLSNQIVKSAEKAMARIKAGA